MKVYQKILSLLNSRKVKFREVSHEAEGRCDVISRIRGNHVSQAMKTIVLMAKITKKDRKYYLAVVPGDKSIDTSAIVKFSDAREGVMFAPKERAEQLTECVMGAVPPFTFNPQLELIVDPSIKENMEIVFNAGGLDRSIFMSVEDYLNLATPTLLNFAKQDTSEKKTEEFFDQRQKVLSNSIVKKENETNSGEIDSLPKDIKQSVMLNTLYGTNKNEQEINEHEYAGAPTL